LLGKATILKIGLTSDLTVARTVAGILTETSPAATDNASVAAPSRATTDVLTFPPDKVATFPFPVPMRPEYISAN